MLKITKRTIVAVPAWDMLTVNRLARTGRGGRKTRKAESGDALLRLYKGLHEIRVKLLRTSGALARAVLRDVDVLIDDADNLMAEG